MIPYGKHSIDEQDIDAVVNVLEHRFLTQGDQVPAFEQALCDYTGAQHCVAVNSGTSGLHIACLAAGVSKGDIVWTVPNSFAASANCALYCGASVNFVDIDPHTFNICLRSLAQKLAQAATNASLPKALVVVHFAGQSCDMQAIKQLTQPHNIVLIEDAAHALGASYQGKAVGSCQYSDIAVFSFHPVKSITTAEGGAVLCNDPTLAQQLALYGKHGITRDPALMQGESHGPWYYQQLALGYNYRLSDLQAALGLSQLRKLREFIAKRKAIAQHYLNILNDLPVLLPCANSLDTSSWHLFMLVLNEDRRAEVYERLHALGIGVNVHYIPIHFHPYYASLGFQPGDFPASEHFYQHALTLPIYPDLSLEAQNQVISALRQILV